MTETPHGHRGPRKVTRESLERIALHYLERFASSSENLRRVLARRVERAARVHPSTDRDQAAAWIDDIVAKLERLGLIDDRAYAELRVASLRRRGASARTIRGKLLQKGVDGDLVDNSLHEGGSEEEAAFAFARRRRLGPYRPRDRKEMRERDLAALSRAGFSYDVALQVVDSSSGDDLDEALRGEA